MFSTWTPADHCSGHAGAGALVFMKWATTTYTHARNLGIYNCLAGETLVMTPDGDVPIADLAGTTATVLTMHTGERTSPRWVEAPIHSYGEQSLMEVTLSRGVDRQIIFATPEHRWVTRYKKSGVDGGGLGHTEDTTRELTAGHVIPSVFPRSGASRMRHFNAGIPHGLVYGDGTIDNTGGARIVLHGAKKMPFAEHFPNQVCSIGQRPEDSEPYAVITGLSRTWKSLPAQEESSVYLYGFLAGWFAADGRVSESGMPTLYCADRDALEQARLLSRRIGIGTNPVRTTKSGGNTVAGRWVEPGIMHSLSFVMAHMDSSFFLQSAHRERFNAAPNGRRPADWRVVSVRETDRVETVYCAEVPDSENFVIGENILTGNCRNVVGGSSYSCHAEGRADDVGWPEHNGRGGPEGHAFVQLLRPVASLMGIQCIIYDRTIWSAKSPGPAGRPYTGAAAHYDHTHVEFTRAAGANLTLATIKAAVIAPGALTPPPVTPPPVTPAGTPTVHLALVLDRLRQNGVYDGTVAAALHAEGLPPTKAGYATWQQRCGYTGSNADGVAGITSLTKLGAKHGWTVVAT